MAAFLLHPRRRYPVVIQALRRKASQISDAPSQRPLGDVRLPSLRSHQQMFPGRHLSQLVAIDVLIAIELQTVLSLPGNLEHRDRQRLGLHAADLGGKRTSRERGIESGST